jgi:hypothetical protein
MLKMFLKCGRILYSFTLYFKNLSYFTSFTDRVLLYWLPLGLNVESCSFSLYEKKRKEKPSLLCTLQPMLKCFKMWLQIG